MNFNLAMTASLDLETIEAMIKQCCEQQTNRKVKSVSINLISGIEPDTGDKYVEVSNATVEFANEPVSNPAFPVYPPGTRSSTTFNEDGTYQGVGGGQGPAPSRARPSSSKIVYNDGTPDGDE